jgi:DNA invertase Pin-like site-specific DNA recombinase
MRGCLPATRTWRRSTRSSWRPAVPKVFQEKVSGAKTDRPELAKVLRRLEAGDVLVVTRLDRLARSTRDRFPKLRK